MGVLEIITEHLIKKQWIVFLVSLLLGLAGLMVIPDTFISMLPFSSRDANVAICYAGISVIFFLVIYFILWLLKRCVLIRAKKKEAKYKANQAVKHNSDIIEQYKTFVDGWSELDYSIVMYLLENENKVPYIQYGFHSGDTILDNDKLFNKAPYSGQKEVSFETREGVRKGFTVGSAYQYLLTKDAYEQFKHILESTGSLSHFPKTRVDLGQ